MITIRVNLKVVFLVLALFVTAVFAGSSTQANSLDVKDPTCAQLNIYNDTFVCSKIDIIGAKPAPDSDNFIWQMNPAMSKITLQFTGLKQEVKVSVSDDDLVNTSLNFSPTTLKRDVVIPSDWRGKVMYIYFDLTPNNGEDYSQHAFHLHIPGTSKPAITLSDFGVGETKLKIERNIFGEDEILDTYNEHRFYMAEMLPYLGTYSGTIHTQDGKLIRSLSARFQERDPAKGGFSGLSWDGRNSKKVEVPCDTPLIAKINYTSLTGQKATTLSIPFNACLGLNEPE